MENTKSTSFIRSLESRTLKSERKDLLQPLVEYVQKKVNAEEVVQLHFICTHNSRRSQFAQMWAQILADHYGVPNVLTYSGGTETTAVYPTVIETMRQLGFKIEVQGEGENPHYGLKIKGEEPTLSLYSKTIDDELNPKSNFAAILTCSQADQACPMVLGADLRIPFTFEDPKKFDNTSMELEKYMERSKDIATELNYLFSQIK